ncbi:hypothetical protein DFH11DRAFT_593059 [Phellopilus nigrolimitatus]|nr:hypothetical protein DFH11DRAFT_593059 [Phellopilus nigrolimitatus]
MASASVIVGVRTLCCLPPLSLTRFLVGMLRDASFGAQTVVDTLEHAFMCCVIVYYFSCLFLICRRMHCCSGFTGFDDFSTRNLNFNYDRPR